MFVIRGPRIDLDIFLNAFSKFVIFTFPGLRLLICPPSGGNERDGVKVSSTAPSALGPKTGKEKGWHLKDLQVLLLSLYFIIQNGLESTICYGLLEAERNMWSFSFEGF